MVSRSCTLFFLKRVGENSGNIFEELKKIKHISNIKVKQDPRLIRRIMPSNIYRIFSRTWNIRNRSSFNSIFIFNF